MTRCKRCDKYLFLSDRCHCQPFRVAILEYDVHDEWEGGKITGKRHIDWSDMYADDEEEAATKAVESYDDCEMTDEAHVIVEDDGGNRSFIVVTSELVREYHGHDNKWNARMTILADEMGFIVPDKQRAQTHLGETYYERTKEKAHG